MEEQSLQMAGKKRTDSTVLEYHLSVHIINTQYKSVFENTTNALSTDLLQRQYLFGNPSWDHNDGSMIAKLGQSIFVRLHSRTTLSASHGAGIGAALAMGTYPAWKAAP